MASTIAVGSAMSENPPQRLCDPNPLIGLRCDLGGGGFGSAGTGVFAAGAGVVGVGGEVVADRQRSLAAAASWGDAVGAGGVEGEVGGAGEPDDRRVATDVVPDPDQTTGDPVADDTGFGGDERPLRREGSGVEWFAGVFD